MSDEVNNKPSFGTSRTRTLLIGIVVPAKAKWLRIDSGPPQRTAWRREDAMRLRIICRWDNSYQHERSRRLCTRYSRRQCSGKGHLPTRVNSQSAFSVVAIPQDELPRYFSSSFYRQFSGELVKIHISLNFKNSNIFVFIISSFCSTTIEANFDLALFTIFSANS